jgi:hypothetical protein
MKYHPLANIFPLMEGAAFDALVADIKANGVRDPLVMHEGLLLDGRNRWRAAETACITITREGIKQFNPKKAGDPLAWVISKNLQRRQLDESQRAMVAARLANLKDGQRSDEVSGTSIEGAATLLNVGRASVERAKTVQREAVPEIVAAVEQGHLAVSLGAPMLRRMLPKPVVIALTPRPPVAEITPLMPLIPEVFGGDAFVDRSPSTVVRLSALPPADVMDEAPLSAKPSVPAPVVLTPTWPGAPDTVSPWRTTVVLVTPPAIAMLVSAPEQIKSLAPGLPAMHAAIAGLPYTRPPPIMKPTAAPNLQFCRLAPWRKSPLGGTLSAVLPNSSRRHGRTGTDRACCSIACFTAIVPSAANTTALGTLELMNSVVAAADDTTLVKLCTAHIRRSS